MHINPECPPMFIIVAPWAGVRRYYAQRNIRLEMTYSLSPGLSKNEHFY